MKLCTLGVLVCAVVLAPTSSFANGMVVFNEVMYHPVDEEPTHEWIELHNQNVVDVDLSGWRLTEGISYTFPTGTLIRGGGYLVVAIAPGTMAAEVDGANVVGPFTGRLSNSGERLELRDLSGRLMDSLSYGVDGNWPVGPDGGGVSLAKKNPRVATDSSSDWAVSAEIGGTPGRANFAGAILTGPATPELRWDSAWRYQDEGVDLGDSWRAPHFDVSAWKTGSGLFVSGETPVPGPRGTVLGAGPNTYYFRTSLTIQGDPASRVWTLRSLVDDGAVIYLNGVESARINMRTGVVAYATQAASSVGNPAVGPTLTIPAGRWVEGENQIAVELHQNSGLTNSGLRVIPVSGVTVTWDGKDGDYFSAASPASAPANDASTTTGTLAVGSSNTTLVRNLNDGRYGARSSWTPLGSDTSPFVYLNFKRQIGVLSVAWSRDNGDTTESECGGTCTDGSLGNYTLQYTLAADPATLTATGSNPTNSWTTLATIQHLSVQPGFTPSLRHRFALATTSGLPIQATAIRLRVPAGASVDELEVNTPSLSSSDAVFGIEVAAAPILPPPPALRFNEVSDARRSGFWLELINVGEAAVSLDGVEIVRSGGTPGRFVGSADSINPGEMRVLTQAELGFSAEDNQKLFLYGAAGSALLDAVTVRTRVRGRSADGLGDWQFPVGASPGASNRFAFQRDVVINEIMYRHRPIDASPAIVSNLVMLPLGAAWKYHDGGVDLGSGWRSSSYDDSLWPAGDGLFQFAAASLPAAAATTLAPGRQTYYFRTRFQLSQVDSNQSVFLRPVIDDGAVFYLNGEELGRVNLPAGTIIYSTSASENVLDADFGEPVVIPASRLRVGENVLAVEVHQRVGATTSTGITINGGGLKLVEEGPVGNTAPNNLAREAGASPFVINSLAGFPIHNVVGLTDGVYGNGNSWIGNSGNPGYAAVRLAGVRTVSSLAFGRDNQGTLGDRTLGLYTVQYTEVASPDTTTTATGDSKTGWKTIGTLNYQSAGSGLFSNPSRRHRFTFNPVEATAIRLLVPATGIGGGTCIDELEINPPETAGDVVFGAELVMSTTLAPAVPFSTSPEEWIELHNRGANPVDLSGWRLDGAIDYVFPADVTIPAQGYIVVAREAAALRTLWPEVATRIWGDFEGRLSSGERVSIKDAFGNLANEVRVFGGVWSDGGGSSLELIDPHADNDHRSAWADSDETQRSDWQTVTYRMISGQRFGSSDWNEFRIGMLDAGECLMDDISVVRDPRGVRQQLIQNGDFEVTTGATRWRLLGNHDGSQIISEPGNPANHVLKVSATGPARTSHNHIESSFVGNTRLVDRQEYEVSYRAKWLAGSPQLHTSAYFQRLARATLLTMPLRHGTPGAVNSRRVPNAGPVLSQLNHSPLTPRTNEPVVITVQASDPDEVASAILSYRVNPAATYTNVPMDRGLDGLWRGTIPGFAAGKVVQFYVRAEDAMGVASFAPADGPRSRALYQVTDNQSSRVAAREFRLIQFDADRDALLRSTNVMSQQRQRGTVIYNRNEVFYDIGVRLHGSAAGRARDGDDYMSYDVEFAPDQLFRGIHSHVGIDRSGRAPNVRQQDEIYVLHMFHRAGLPCHRVDLCYFIAPRTGHTGPAILQLGAYDGLFVEEQFGEDGAVYNLDLTYEPSTTVNGNYESLKLPVPLQAHIGTDFADLGDDKEQYRYPFNTRLNERADDFSGIMRLCKTMGAPQAQFNAQIGTALDVDRAARHTALTILCGIGDNYFSSTPSLPHNARIFTPSDGGIASFLPWDMDFVFTQPADSSIFPTTSANISKLINFPATRRLYLWHVNDLCQGAFNSGYLGPWLAHYGTVVGQNYSAASTYIQSRRTAALRQLPVAVPFAITNNGGNSFEVATNQVTLSGTAWIDIRALRLAGASNSLAVSWVDVTRWQVTLPLARGANSLVLEAMGAGTNIVAVDQIVITSTASGADADLDGDGMPDEWELGNGLNPAVADATGDLDADGLSNLQEYIAGTNPRDLGSSLRLTVVSESGALQLRFSALAGRTYTVFRRSQIADGEWVAFAQFASEPNDRAISTEVPAGLPGVSQYFRLVVSKP
jgi:hypothetical protein